MTSPAYNAAIGAAGDGLSRVIDEALNGMACAPGAVPTGFDHLDGTLGGGLRRGQLTVIAGAPGVGTSVLALGLARDAAFRHGLPTLFMAPDSSQREILCRVVAAEAAVPVSHVRAGRTAAGDTEKLRRFQSRLEEAPLLVSAGWLAPRPVPLDEAVGDYAQMVGVAVVDATPDDADVIRSLKVVAQRFDIVLVVTVKTALINAPLDRTERPRLPDLRGPANLAELADLVIACIATTCSMRGRNVQVRPTWRSSNTATAPPASCHPSHFKVTTLDLWRCAHERRGRPVACLRACDDRRPDPDLAWRMAG